MALDLRNLTESSTIHDKLCLYARRSAPGERVPKLIFESRLGNPRIVVWTRDESVKAASGNERPLKAGMDLPTMYNFLDKVTELADAVMTGEYKKEGFNKSYKFVTYKSPKKNDDDKPEPVSAANCGIDDDGMVWISVVEKDTPHIRFYFALSDWHDIYKSDGTLMNKSEKSALHAKSMARILRKLFTHEMTTPDTMAYNAMPYQEKQEMFKGGGGAQKSNAKAKAPQGAPAQDQNFEDDIPF